MAAALRCVRPQFQWYQLAYTTEINSMQLHDSTEGFSQNIVSITLHYIKLHYITLHYITLHYIHYFINWTIKHIKFDLFSQSSCESSGNFTYYHLKNPILIIPIINWKSGKFLKISMFFKILNFQNRLYFMIFSSSILIHQTIYARIWFLIF